MDKRNNSGCMDMTAYLALSIVEREETEEKQRKKRRGRGKKNVKS